MTTYTLTIQFDPNDLQTISLANELVTIVSDVSAIVTSAQPANTINMMAIIPTSVVWQAFQPFENNTVTWSDSYQLYASQVLPAGGAIIQQQAQQTAVVTKILPYQINGIFGPPESGVSLPMNVFGVSNQYQSASYLAFGLSAAANVNGMSIASAPMNASAVPTNQDAQFSPTNNVQVFLQTGTANGMVLPNSIANVTPFLLSASTGGFYQVS
jgi:hypothetical protein